MDNFDDESGGADFEQDASVKTAKIMTLKQRVFGKILFKGVSSNFVQAFGAARKQLEDLRSSASLLIVERTPKFRRNYPALAENGGTIKGMVPLERRSAACIVA